MRKVISYSLWGSDPKYTVGAIRNAELAPMIYPDWVCRFYVASNVPAEILDTLSAFPHTELVPAGRASNESIFWRFYAAGDSNIDVMISRDTDSRLSIREKCAVDDWLASDFEFHILRDHPWHSTPIMGGMWGAKRGCIPNIRNQIRKYLFRKLPSMDQIFLSKKIYPLIKDRALVHDEIFECKAFPKAREEWEFVGEIFDQNDNNIAQHTQILRNWYSERIS